MPRGKPNITLGNWEQRASSLKRPTVKVEVKKQVNSKKAKKTVYFKDGEMDERIEDAMRFANGKTNAVVIINRR